MTARGSFLIKLGLGLALGLVFLNTIAVVRDRGVTPLEIHEQWVRQNLYPVWATRIGHILETYVEPPIWQKIKEDLLANKLLIALIVLSGLWVKRKTAITTSRFRFGLWAGLGLAWIIFTWQLKKIPPGVYVDEAVTGYNAYSLLLTGRDEWGKAFPILFRYFGSWLPFLNLYFLVPAVKIWGLSELAVRLPAAILGVGVVLVTYVLIKIKTRDETTAGLGAIFLPVVPWMVFNARLGYEEMLGYILFLAGCGLLYRSVKSKSLLKWAILALSLASYDAHVFRYLMGIILPVWAVINWKTVRLWPIKFWGWILVWLVLTQFLNILVVNTPAFWVKQVIYEGTGWVQIAGNFWRQLTIYFSPGTMFVKIPDIDMQHQIPGTGLFVWWMIVPIVWGITGWIGKWRQNIWWLALLVMCAIPAAMSGEFISVQRALPMLLPLTMAMAEGLKVIWINMNKIARLLLMTGLFFYSGGLVFRSYFVLLPGLHQEAWNYGYKQLTEVILADPQINYVVDNSRNVRNYMLPLFYSAYSPKKLQSEVDAKVVANYYFSGDMDNYHNFGNMSFRPIDWKNDECKKQIIVGDKLSISDQQAREHALEKRGEILSRTGQVLLRWHETSPEVKCNKHI